ncbi:unnamed protein product [Moneuplotes crassus]|uniref:Amino acid transporter transmembrane domain-containing protein n=1 Tax=Euplotes crassus TaxID=5936 RepID=A0AAD1XCW1_EUPCR|nr:unnamed protein product [Moneuplotes crassus]
MLRVLSDFGGMPISSGPLSNRIGKDGESKESKGVSVFFCMLTLISTRIGGGIIGLPFASQKMGFMMSLLLQLLYIPLGFFSCWLLLEARTITGRASFSDLGIYSYGNISIYIINALIAIGNLGFSVIFFIVFGDVSGNLMTRFGVDEDSFFTSRIFTQSALGFILLYLCIQKHISSLKYSGLFTMFLCFVFVVLFFIHGMVSSHEPGIKADILNTKIDVTFFTAISTIFTSYGFQTAFFTAFQSLKNKTNRNGELADIWTRICIFTIFNVTVMIAYGLYGEDIEKNLLMSISNDSGVLPAVLEVIFILVPALAIPVIFYVGKEAMLIFVDELTRKSYSKQNTKKTPKIDMKVSPDIEAQNEGEKGAQYRVDEEGRDHAPKVEQPSIVPEQSSVDPLEYLKMKNWVYYLVTILCYIICVVTSIAIEDVSIFFGFIGASLGGFALWLGPGSFYIIGVHKEKVKLNTPLKKLAYFFAWGYVFIGLIVFFGLNICNVINLI